jgi:uncharacterized 2Fe-2S/4Fe-4S cluster protein (DUF4445 family)
MTAPEQFDLTAYGLDHSPVIRSVTVAVEPPSLRDNTGLFERISRAVTEAIGVPVGGLALPLGRKLNRLFSDSSSSIWVAYQMEGNQIRLVDVRPQTDTGPVYGLAVDIGSSTLVLSLVALDRSRIIEQITLENPQVEYGADILTRAHFAEQAGGLATLAGVLRQKINQGISILCDRNNVEADRILGAALAGNTAMTHFFLKLPTASIIREPYVPVINRPQGLTAAELDLEISPCAPVMVLPNKGAYFGGDLMAGLVLAGFNRAEKPCLLVDVGTNAEVVLGQKDWLIGAAGAAGPALEGGVARMGMTAGPGAIDRVRIDRHALAVEYQTIDDLPPQGICGSGLIDLLAELFLSGIIDFSGKLTLSPGHDRLVGTDEGPAFVVVPADETDRGEPILLSEVEIDILLRSKAAMYTILETITGSVGLDFDQIDRFFIAGTFGQFIDPRMAVAIGMLPDIPLEKYQSLGNSSLKGTILTLLSEKARNGVQEMWERLTYLELNVNQDLMNRFSAARFIPHTHRELFPSVGTSIG